MLWNRPPAAARTLVRAPPPPFTCTGVVVLTRVPFPSWPRPPCPIAQRSPAVLVTSVWLSPPVAAAFPVARAVTSVGVRTQGAPAHVLVGLMPSWPQSSRPQAQTAPPVVTARL